MSVFNAENPLLQKFIQQQRIGVITDMDGTLAPIVPNPSDARPTDHNLELLQKLNKILPLVAVVSGRGAADVRERVGLDELVYAGNHGLERWRNGGVAVAPAVQPYLDAIQRARQDVEAIAPPGMWVEDKGATLSIHYRGTDDPQKTARDYRPRILALAEDHDLRMFEGRMIFEIRPPLNMHKGTIFKQLIEENELDAAVYLGDDTTDADALRTAARLRENGDCFAIGVGVQSPDTPEVVTSSADVLVAGVSGVESFFDWLLNALMAS